jgi:lysozyme
MSFERFWVREVVKGPATVNGQPWIFWQFSERGRLGGISGYADMDVFRGDRAEFEALQSKR